MVSNKKIDQIFEYALKNGASSGKLLGAGGGGFCIFLSKNMKEKRKLIKSLKSFL